jgi:hypothetical protein
MTTKLFIERCLVDRKRSEELLAVQEARQRGLEVVFASTRGVAQMEVSAQTLCVGSINFLKAAVQAAGNRLPDHVPYPSSLQGVLHREIGFAARLSHLVRTQTLPLFVKPAQGWKRFTGMVLEDAEAIRTHRISVHQSVWWSQPVGWLSEWRAYCARGEVLEVHRSPHSAANGPPIDLGVVERAAAELFAAAGASGAVLDFGVLTSGETALIEANDGFAFGGYGNVSSSTLWRVWTARWPELVASSPPQV